VNDVKLTFGERIAIAQQPWWPHAFGRPNLENVEQIREESQHVLPHRTVSFIKIQFN